MENTTTFWNFIKNNEIEIPIIQRDYAQGRIGKENLRKTFLNDLKDALDDEQGELKLDFVYSSGGFRLNPLDGQQRLTTLWLLHWYIALKAGVLNDENCKILNRFTYETRISSREFCRSLCNSSYFSKYKDGSIVDFIEKQTWFYSVWKQDPTIQSMLRMLGRNASQNTDVLDCIENIFKDTDDEKFLSYWKCLAEQRKIVFSHLPLKDFGLSDDLYIKMNARGKQLTNFENFKADLIGYIENQSKISSNKDRWNRKLDPERGIPIKMDTIWINVFWDKRSKKNEVDDIYLAFINRFFWNELILAKYDDGKPVLLVGKGEVDGREIRQRENVNKSYKYLNNENELYSLFDPYEYYDKSIPIECFEKLEVILDKIAFLKKNNQLQDFEKNILCGWDDSFRFIPEYKNDVKDDAQFVKITDKITTLSQIHRVVFFAVCKYFIDGDFDSTTLRRWMRFVWNLVSGILMDGDPQIRSTEAIRAAIETIQTIDSHNVYESLKKCPKCNNLFSRRYYEECEKAKQILDENGNMRKYDGACKRLDGSEYQTWEDLIVDAEKYSFFRGSIKFLFINGRGAVDWTNCDLKWNQIRMFFDEKENAEVVKKNTDLLKMFLNKISDFDNLNQIYFNASIPTWLNKILLNDQTVESVDRFLMSSECGQEFWDSEQKKVFGDIKEIISGVKDRYQLDKDGDHYLLKVHGRGNGQEWKKFYIGNNRNKVVAKFYGGKINSDPQCQEKIYTDQKIEGCEFFWGTDIKFKYKNRFFKWLLNDDVCVLENDESIGKKFHYSDGLDFLKELDAIISQ